MWEFTSPEGLNYAIDESDPSKIVRVVSADEPTGERCERYGFDVGQSNGNPPIHPFHKDIGLGRVNRIVGFKSLNELSIDVEFKGSSGIIDFDGRGPTLKVRYFPGRAAGRVRHFLEGGGRAAELRPDHVYEIDPSLQSISETPATNERPESDFSTAEALRQCVYGNTVRSPCGKLYIPRQSSLDPHDRTHVRL